MAPSASRLFDKVVFAAPPDQTLALLEDPTEAERRRFGAWLGDGLQEGAVTSAVAVSLLLGGAAIP